MSDINEPTTPQEIPAEADEVLALQETPAEEEDVQAHSAMISTLSVECGSEAS